jgi:multidrug efflux pump subunit AcrA (membrane-fusion protein)
VPGAGQGTVWVYDGNHIHPAAVKTGVSDSQFTEIVDGSLQEGTTIATQVTLPGSTATRTTPATNNPLMGPSGPRRF